VAAIDTCEKALAVARAAGPDFDRAQELMGRCSSLIAGPRCREAEQREHAHPAAGTLRDTIEACAREYCPRLPDAKTLAACDRASPVTHATLTWVPLRQAMLRHDFPASELPRAAQSVISVAEYVQETPPPSTRVDHGPGPEFEVRITSSGFTVARDGKDRGTVATFNELHSILPKSTGNRQILVRAAPEITYEQVISTMDVLRDLGYDEVSFAVRR